MTIYGVVIVVSKSLTREVHVSPRYYITPFFFLKQYEKNEIYKVIHALFSCTTYQSYADCPNLYGLLRTLVDFRRGCCSAS